MKFIIDANLPASIAESFVGHEVRHTSELELGNSTPDQFIIEISHRDAWVLITKDADFYYSFIATGKPYKLVLVKLGNMRLREVRSYFRNNANRLISLLEANYFIILEPQRMRVLK